MRIKILLCLSLFFINQIQAQSLNDNFNGTTVDTSLWSVILPFSQSQVTESGGFLTTVGRGILATTAGFSSPYSISGAVTLNNSLEHFQVILRSDLSYDTASGISQYDELDGIHVSFSADGGQISIQQFDGSNPNPPILAEENYNFTVGQLYDFSITDTGSEVSLAIDGQNLISSDTIFGTGNQIAFYSREFSGTSSSLDYVSIAPVPEPSSFALVAIGILLASLSKSKIQTVRKMSL